MVFENLYNHIKYCGPVYTYLSGFFNYVHTFPSPLYTSDINDGMLLIVIE